MPTAVELIASRTSLRPRVGVVLGSGLGAFADTLDDRVVIPYGEIPDWPQSTAIGHAGKLAIGKVEGVTVAALAGRAHLYEGYTAKQAAFGIRTLRGLGVESLVLTNAAGGIRAEWKPGTLVLLSDHINLLGQNPLSGANDVLPAATLQCLHPQERFAWGFVLKMLCLEQARVLSLRKQNLRGPICCCTRAWALKF